MKSKQVVLQIWVYLGTILNILMKFDSHLFQRMIKHAVQ